MAFAGLKFADAGSFDYGRNYGVTYDVTSRTDVLPEFGGDTYGADNFMQQRGNGYATYRNTDFFGWWMARTSRCSIRAKTAA